MTTAAVLVASKAPRRSSHLAGCGQSALTPGTLSRLATRALWEELALFPKPGLVSLRDSGSHSDMDASTFVRSLFALRAYFHSIAAAGACGARFAELRDLGLRAESEMLRATGGVNTHRGAIFALGLLAAAAALSSARAGDVSDHALRKTLQSAWGNELGEAVSVTSPASHGMQAAQRHGVTGARGEARAGFPSVFELALPALREARKRGHDARRARLAAFFALLERVSDTNVLYRAGRGGLDHMRRAAVDFHVAGGVDSRDAIKRAVQIHQGFVIRRLSPGGCADLLAAALFVDSVQAAR